MSLLCENKSKQVLTQSVELQGVGRVVRRESRELLYEVLSSKLLCDSLVTLQYFRNAKGYLGLLEEFSVPLPSRF